MKITTMNGTLVAVLREIYTTCDDVLIDNIPHMITDQFSEAIPGGVAQSFSIEPVGAAAKPEPKKKRGRNIKLGPCT